MTIYSSQFPSSLYTGLGQRAHADYSSCRLGRRKQSVRMSWGRASAGRKVDTDMIYQLLKQQQYQAQLQMYDQGMQAISSQLANYAARDAQIAQQAARNWYEFWK